MVGAGNIDVNSGTAALVQGSEISVGAQNEAVLRSNAARRAYGFQVQAAEDTAQGQVATLQAQQDITRGQIGAEASLLGTAGSVADKWFKFKSLIPPGASGDDFGAASSSAIY